VIGTGLKGKINFIFAAIIKNKIPNPANINLCIQIIFSFGVQIASINN
jgi:hypothetical protein